MHSHLTFATLALITTTAAAQQISRSTLETILDDQILLEDFESLSIHAGSNFEIPNPLNESTAANFIFSFDVLPGINYESPTALYLYSLFNNGDEDVILRAETTLTITFTEPQVAFGFDFGLADAQITIYTHNNTILDQITTTNNPFFGYQAPTQGITSLTITHPTSTILPFNDVAYGAVFTPCPADLNNDAVQDFFDVSLFLTYFANEDDRADLTDDGQYDFFDVSAFLTNLTIACP